MRYSERFRALGDGFLEYQPGARRPGVKSLKLACAVHILVVLLLEFAGLKQVRFWVAVAGLAGDTANELVEVEVEVELASGQERYDK